MLTVWLASAGFFLAFLFTVIRTEVLNPRLGWTPSAPYYERAAYDLMGCAAGLRGWLIFSGHLTPTPSEVLLAVSLGGVTGLGLLKVVTRTGLLRWPAVDAGSVAAPQTALVLRPQEILSRQERARHK